MTSNPVEGVLQVGDWIETHAHQIFTVLSMHDDADGRRVLLLGGENGRTAWKHEQTLHKWGLTLTEPPMALQFEMEIGPDGSR